jgi:hypothetical protein
MASVAMTKFYQFVQDLGLARFNFSADVLMAALTNTAPVAGDTITDTVTTPCTVKSTSNAVEIAAGNGYTKKGISCTVTSWTNTTGTSKLAVSLDQMWLCATAAMATFRYLWLFDDTLGAAATRPVIGFYDYGTAITLGVGETFTLDTDASAGVLTIA